MGDSNRHADNETLKHLVDVRVEKAQLEDEVERLNRIVEKQQQQIEELKNEISKGAKRYDHAGVSKS